MEKQPYILNSQLKNIDPIISIAQQSPEMLNKSELAAIRLFKKALFLHKDSKLNNSIIVLEKAIELSLKTKNNFMASHFLGTMGHFFLWMGDFDRALGCLERAYAVCTEANGSLMGNLDIIYKRYAPLFQIAFSGDIAVIYQELHDIDKAIKFYTKSLNLCKVIGNNWGEAVNLQNLGTIYSKKGDNQRALGHYHKALSIYKSLSRDKEQISTLVNLANLYQKIDSFHKSFDCAKQALRISRQNGNKESKALALHSMASHFLHYGNPEKAIKYLTEAIEVSEQSSNNILLNLFWNRGLAYEALKDISNAYRDFGRAIDVFENLRGMLFSEEHKTNYIKSKAHLYSKIILFCQNNNLSIEAYNYVERSKSRMFLELIATTSILPPLNINDDIRVLLKQENECLSNIQNINLEQHHDNNNSLYDTGQQLSININNLNKIYKLMSDINPATDEYISLRRGSPFNFETIKRCLV